MKKKFVIITLVLMSILSQISFGGEDDIQKPILQRILLENQVNNAKLI